MFFFFLIGSSYTHVQLSLQKQNWNEECSHAFETYSGSGAAASKYPSEAPRKRSREKAYAADRVCISPSISHITSMLFIYVKQNKLSPEQIDLY